MRVLVLLACLVALSIAANYNTYVEDKKIKFNYDVHKDLPLSLYVEGELDPRNENMNRIQAFLKLANKYIPILESLAGKQNDLKWERRWSIQFAGVNLDVYAYFQLMVGWKVNPGNYTMGRFDVTYYPFVYGTTFGRVNGTTWLAVGSTEVGLLYVLAYTPISLQLYNSAKVCFQGSYVVEPVRLRQHLFAALTECHDEVLDDIISGHPFDWKCNLTAPVNITIWDMNFTNMITGDFIPQTCIQF